MVEMGHVQPQILIAAKTMEHVEKDRIVDPTRYGDNDTVTPPGTLRPQQHTLDAAHQFFRTHLLHLTDAAHQTIPDSCCRDPGTGIALIPDIPSLAPPKGHLQCLPLR